MVDHLVTVAPDRRLGEPRAAELGKTLRAAGFEAACGGGRPRFTSTTVEAAAAKALLRARGFRDRDFTIVLEYARRWGVL